MSAGSAAACGQLGPTGNKAATSTTINAAPFARIGSHSTPLPCSTGCRIGLDVALEALKLYRGRRNTKINDLLRFAAICRVDKIIRPHLEALL
jgi:hypothetical protein